MPDTEQLDEDKRCTLFDKPKKFCQRCSEFHAADDWMPNCEPYIGAAPIRQCKVCGGWHALDAWRGNCLPEPNWNRSEHPSPGFISDNLEALGGLDGLRSMVSGTHYTSKAELRREYRRAGVEEVGNESVKTWKPTACEDDIAKDLKQTIETLTSDNISNDEVANMLRSPAPVEHGITIA